MSKGSIRKDWIQGAVKKPGSFTKEAKHADESVHDFAEEKKHAKGKVGKRARLALTFEAIRHNKK